MNEPIRRIRSGPGLATPSRRTPEAAPTAPLTESDSPPRPIRSGPAASQLARALPEPRSSARRRRHDANRRVPRAWRGAVATCT
eukprot:scaffold2261_cov405-Prasinococcus_capsulatus_cf.AAC.7